MRLHRLILVLPLGLAGCAELGVIRDSDPPPTAASAAAEVPPPPPADARTVEEFDTTTDEQRQAALASSGGGERALGETVASLGDPAQPGFWLRTPLARAPGTGRVRAPQTGRSAQVDLIPVDGPAGGGSEASLALLRLLGLPLTELAPVEVFAAP